MEGMSWSDDTRCLYCEGRLPLYRKITHGQFCSSAHRKSYWQEHERLALERLHESHSSLRSYRPVEATQEASQQNAAYPDLELLTQAKVATYPEVDTALELDSSPSSDVSSYPIPDVSEPAVEAPELLNLLGPELVALGGSPALIAADPLEYEITMQPLSPLHVSGMAVAPLPEGPPVAAWSYIGLGASSVTTGSGGASIELDGELRHPRSQDPAVGIRSASRIGLPLTAALKARRAAIKIGSSLQILTMEPVPVTSVELKVPVESDVLLQLFDQQVPHPDRLYELRPFAVQPSNFALAGQMPEQFDAAPSPVFSLGSTAAVTDYRLVSAAERLPFSVDVLPKKGALVSRTVVSEIATNPHSWISAVAMPSPDPSVYSVGKAGLQSLPSLQGPVEGSFARQTAKFLAFDLSMGVSSDVTYPRMASAVATSDAPLITRMLPLTFAKKRKAVSDSTPIQPIARLLPQPVELQPMLPSSGLEPLDRKPAEDALRKPQSVVGSLRGNGLWKLEPAWAHATGFWHHAPRDLKILLFTIPALLALVFHPGWPRVAFAAPQPSTGLTGSFRRVLNGEWVNVRQSLENRAAVALDEDFRSGLDNWASPGGSTTEWSFDATGFVQPGPLALYRPSVNLTDYQMQFLGLIDKKALSWVVRAADFENFYVVKLEVLKPGPLPVIGLTRYAVINGKSTDRHDVNIRLDARADTVYRVRMDVQGSNFLVEVQGQIADSWTETRLPRGGVGFFTASGEASRLRWMQITHQYDMLGRLCAYLAPYDTTNGSWQP
jgi:hypothetical protein